MAIMTTTTETVVKDQDGNILSTEINTDSQNIHKSDEGDFIKIYTKGLNDLPDQLTLPAFRLLIQMAQYAGYADINDMEGGMLIQLSAIEKAEIQNKLNIKERAFYKNLKNLTDLNLLREIRKNCYQLNPNLIGKGYFEYKANYKQGGIKDLREYWQDGCKKRIVRIEDNRYVLTELVEEVRKIGKKLKQAEYAKNYKAREEIQSELVKYLKAMKELSQTEYSKFIKYAIDNDDEIKKLKAEEEQIKQQKEDAIKQEQEALQKAMDEASKPLTKEEYESMFSDYDEYEDLELDKKLDELLNDVPDDLKDFFNIGDNDDPFNMF